MSGRRRNFENNPQFGRHEHGRRMRHGRRGRPPVFYPVEINREINTESGIIELSSFELQILQLSDIEDMNQKEIAEKLNVSQTSVWRYLKGVREKIARAISNHHEVIIEIRD